MALEVHLMTVYDGLMWFHYRCNGWIGWNDQEEIGQCMKCGMSGTPEQVREQRKSNTGHWRIWAGDFLDENTIPFPHTFEGQENRFATRGETFADYYEKHSQEIWKNRPQEGEELKSEMQGRHDEIDYGA